MANSRAPGLDDIKLSDVRFSLDRLDLMSRLARVGLVADEWAGVPEFFALCEFALRQADPVTALREAIRFRSSRLVAADDHARAARQVREMEMGLCSVSPELARRLRAKLRPGARLHAVPNLPAEK